jgi:hypothetical protein
MREETVTVLKELLINKLNAILINMLISLKNSEMKDGSKLKSTITQLGGKKVETIDAPKSQSHTFVLMKAKIALVKTV